MRPRGSSNKPICWIVRVPIRELRGQCSDFCRDGFDNYILRDQLNRGFNGSVGANSPLSE